MQGRAWPLKLSPETRDNLEDNLASLFHRLFALGIGDPERTGPEIKTGRRRDDGKPAFVKDLGLQSQHALETGDLMNSRG